MSEPEQPEVRDDAADAVEEGDAGEEGDDVRQKFRDALERKQRSRGKQAGDGTSKKNSKGVTDAHGPATKRREFRRKSG